MKAQAIPMGDLVVRAAIEIALFDENLGKPSRGHGWTACRRKDGFGG